ncbi:hypothetical protein OPV22_031388 [Ensete ventricosum]|uniref:Uncharacterized protein n=1 Tax=Ensete ventricosum TaxID=4639 RepID=A0AAV8PKW0_ENSVE|nr:hypothetical protein OPV22_031388 [Ensete ventricosum]
MLSDQNWIFVNGFMLDWSLHGWSGYMCEFSLSRASSGRSWMAKRKVRDDNKSRNTGCLSSSPESDLEVIMHIACSFNSNSTKKLQLLWSTWTSQWFLIQRVGCLNVLIRMPLNHHYLDLMHDCHRTATCQPRASDEDEMPSAHCSVAFHRMKKDQGLKSRRVAQLSSPKR